MFFHAVQRPKQKIEHTEVKVYVESENMHAQSTVFVITRWQQRWAMSVVGYGAHYTELAPLNFDTLINLAAIEQAVCGILEIKSWVGVQAVQ